MKSQLASSQCRCKNCQPAQCEEMQTVTWIGIRTYNNYTAKLYVYTYHVNIGVE